MVCNNQTPLSYVSKGKGGIIWDREEDCGSQKEKRVIITPLAMFSSYYVPEPPSTDR